MVVDSSALIAILRREPEEHIFRDAIKAAPTRLLSASTHLEHRAEKWIPVFGKKRCSIKHLEAGIVAIGRRGDAGMEALQALVETLKLVVVPLSGEHARLAIDAFRRYGTGRHPAGVNFGDCFSYALAKATGEPLLFKGDAFSQTDIKRVA